MHFLKKKVDCFSKRYQIQKWRPEVLKAINRNDNKNWKVYLYLNHVQIWCRFIIFPNGQNSVNNAFCDMVSQFLMQLCSQRCPGNLKQLSITSHSISAWEILMLKKFQNNTSMSSWRLIGRVCLKVSRNWRVFVFAYSKPFVIKRGWTPCKKRHEDLGRTLEKVIKFSNGVKRQ